MDLRTLDLRSISKVYEEKLSKIKVALFDVDGILTDGRIYWSGEEVGWNRWFHTNDGYGMKVLMEAGLKVGVITGGKSLGVIRRFEMLGVDFLFYGNEDKRSAYLEVLAKTGFTDENILYMGDEFFDMPLLKRAGFSATVPGATPEVKEIVNYVTYREGGHGAAREVIDLLRFAQGIKPKIDSF